MKLILLIKKIKSEHIQKLSLVLLRRKLLNLHVLKYLQTHLIFSTPKHNLAAHIMSLELLRVVEAIPA